MKQIVAIVVLICAGFGTGCQSAPEKHYPIQGDVISTDPAKKLLTVKHGDIPALMPAMTMTYQVAEPRQIETLQPGDKITADLVVSESKGRLEKIVLVSKGDGKTSPGTSQRIPEKGDSVPDFALVNQDGKIIHLSNYRGKVLLVTFIYTRCPLPDYCPRMNENFRAVQKLLQEIPGATERAEFLSISFDPEHDTPAVLKHYASRYKNLPEMARYFGLVYQPEQVQIVHSLSTTVIGADGKVVKWYSDNEWTPADAAQAIATVIQRG